MKFIFLFFLSIIPLIRRLYSMDLRVEYKKYWKGDDFELETFAWWKSRAILLWAIILLAGGSVFLFRKRKNILDCGKALLDDNVLAPLWYFLIMLSISAWYSNYPRMAFEGFPHRFEGIWVWLAYGVIATGGSVLFQSKKDLKYLPLMIYVSTALMGTLGLLDYFGKSFFSTTVGVFLTMPEEFRRSAISFPETAGQNVGTLGNINYVGSYYALMTPVFVAMLISSKSYKARILTGGMSLFCFINLYLSHSRAGILGLIAGLIILLVVSPNPFTHLFRRILPWALVAGAATGIMLYILNQNDITVRHFLNGFSEFRNPPVLPLKEFAYGANESEVKLVGRDDSLNFQYDATKQPPITFSVPLPEGGTTPLPVTPPVLDTATNSITFSLDHPLYKKYSFIWWPNTKVLRFDSKDPNSKMQFWLIYEQNKWLVIGFFGHHYRLDPVPRAFPLAWDPFMSWRGGLWSRYLALWKNYLTIGEGPDTFAPIFPRGDVVYNTNRIGMFYWIADKPHNLYIQVLLSAGLIGFVAFIASISMFVVRGVSGFHRVRKLAWDHETHLLTGLFSGCCGYLVAGIFNDSVVHVAPVFWGFFGIIIGLSSKILLTDDKVATAIQEPKIT